MGCFWNFFVWLLFMWQIRNICGQSTSYYKRTYYNTAGASPALSRYHPPLTHQSDLIYQESSRKDKSSKTYNNKVPFRPYVSEEEDFSNEHYVQSAENSNESHGYSSISTENDSREINLGTHIRVQHPSTVPKKNFYAQPTKKSRKYPEASSLRAEPPTKKRPTKYTTYYEADPFHVVPPPKSTISAPLPTSVGYNVYEDDQDQYVPVRSKSKSYDRYKGVASKKQIDKYLEDQEKLLDEALKNQLLKNPKYLKYFAEPERDQERESEQEIFETDFTPNSHGSFRGTNNFNENSNFKTNRPHRRPPGRDLKHAPRRNPNRKFRSAIVINV